MEYVRGTLQEMDPEVCRAHIDLYVNDFTLDYGPGGRAGHPAPAARRPPASAVPTEPGRPTRGSLLRTSWTLTARLGVADGRHRPSRGLLSFRV